MEEHALFPPSSNHRLIACPASHKEEAMAPVEEESIYAARGTYLHALVPPAYAEGEEAIQQHRDTEHWWGTCEREDLEQVMECVDYAKLVGATCNLDTTVTFEQRVYMESWGIDDQWGTADLSLDDPKSKILHLMDWKFGSTPVYAQDNEQLLTYAAGKTQFPIRHKEFCLHLVQPPLNYEGVFVVDAEELRQFVYDVLAPAIELAKSDNPPYNPGKKQCQFCSAAMTCTARHKKQMDNAITAFQAYKKMPDITADQLGKALDAADDYVAYINKLRAHVLEGLLRGKVRATGWKAVSGRGSRDWQDEKKTLAYLEDSEVADDMFTSKLISPSKAEGLRRRLKKDPDFQALIVKKDGQPQLSKADNPKPALTPTRDAVSVFAKLKS